MVHVTIGVDQSRILEAWSVSMYLPYRVYSAGGEKFQDLDQCLL